MYEYGRFLLILFILVSSSFKAIAESEFNEYCLYMQHESTLFAGQGYCAYKFLFNSCYENTMNNIKISTFAITDIKKDINSTIDIDTIGASRAEQYKERTLELPCDIKSINIKSAEANINGKTVDLIATSILKIDNSFKPIEIYLKKVPTN